MPPATSVPVPRKRSSASSKASYIINLLLLHEALTIAKAFIERRASRRSFCRAFPKPIEEDNMRGKVVAIHDECSIVVDPVGPKRYVERQRCGNSCLSSHRVEDQNCVVRAILCKWHTDQLAGSIEHRLRTRATRKVFLPHHGA